MVPTDIVNSVTIKLEPGLDQIIDTETYNNNQDDQVMEITIRTLDGTSRHFTVPEIWAVPESEC